MATRPCLLTRFGARRTLAPATRDVAMRDARVRDDVNDEERYLFDLMGYIVVDDVLTGDELRELNALLEAKDLWGAYERDHHGTIVGEQNNLHVGPLHTWEAPFRRLIDHPKLIPYLAELIGPKFRFDHGYAILMKRGGSQHPLHGGNTPYDPGQYYHVRNGRM